MSDKPTESGYSIEALMQLARNTPAKQLIEFDSRSRHYMSVASWLRAHDIKRGKTHNYARPLYKHYVAWCKANNADYTTPIRFGTFLVKLFPRARMHNGNVYYLNKKVENESQKEKR